MAKYNFGAQSVRNMRGLDKDLQKVLFATLDLGVMDFSVISGLRTQAEQDELYAIGRTKPGEKVTWTRNSRHLTGEAVDIAPYPIDWKDEQRFAFLAGLMMGQAARLGVDLEWGYHLWGKDMPHFQLGRK